MNKFVLISFAFLGWVFWELSGGTEFEPKKRTQATKTKTTEQTPSVPVLASAALSVPLVKATTDQVASEVTVEPAVFSVATPAPLTAAKEVAQPQVVVASLAAGLQSFSTPGAPVLLPVTAAADSTPGSNGLTVPADLRRVRGSRVNMRGGPGTSFGVLSVLARDQEVEVLRENGSGWVKLRDIESGRVGWMAAKMLTPRKISE